jgi:hypothetical protein
MINFEMCDVDNVALFSSGKPPVYKVHWFALSDGMYWLSFAETNIYEYADKFLENMGSDVKFVDYQIIRLIEDFTELFAEIGEMLPSDLYGIVKTPENLQAYLKTAKQWYETHEDFDNDDSDDIWDKYFQAISWINSRTLTAIHLQNGPNVGFFRFGEKIHILWKTDQVGDDGLRVWSAENGSLTMLFSDFIREIEEFGQFFSPLWIFRYKRQ